VVFYARGFNAPYNEGNIIVIRNFVKALLLADIRSSIFSFRYPCAVPSDDDQLKTVIYDHSIPFIGRDAVFHGKSRISALYSSLAESLGMVKFFTIEKRLQRPDGCIANVVNCFRFPRFALKDNFAAPVVLHMYMSGAHSRNISKLIADRSDAIVVSSNAVKHYVETVLNVREDKLHLIYPPVDMDLFKPADKMKAKGALGVPQDEKIVLYLGGLKDPRFPVNIVLDIVKEVAKENPKTRFLIYAPINHENMRRAIQISRAAQEKSVVRNIAISVAELSDQQKSLIYNAADVFLFPSLGGGTAIEPPMTVLEAMSCGLPVFSNHVLSTDEVITDNFNGSLLDFDNLETRQIADRLSLLIHSKQMLEQMSRNSRQRIDEIASLRKTCNSLMSVYKSLDFRNGI
jgi:glycosyltransferase involved in cell wall biosynthesis